MPVLGQGHVSFWIGDDAPDFLDRVLTHEDFGMAEDEATALLGDRAARVGVSMDMSDKDFGNGFGAHVSVSLSCNQDLSTIELAGELATDACRMLLPEALNAANSNYKAYVKTKKKKGNR